MRLLFVCSQNLLRSPTAEAVFAEYDGIEALSAGTAPDATTPVSADLLEWAELIFVMENRHRDALRRKFSTALRHKKVIVLGIPDIYRYMDPRLIPVLKQKVDPYLRRAGRLEIPTQASS